MEDIVIFGTSGHAKVVHDIIIKQRKYNVVAFVSSNTQLGSYLGLPHFHQDDISRLDFIQGVVAVGDNSTRDFLVKFILEKKPSFKFISAIHPSAVVATDVTIDIGTVIMANSVVNAGTKIGKHVIINTGSLIDHDCILKDFCSVAPGVVMGGNVSIGQHSVISLGTDIIHNIVIGEHTVVGAGSLVLKNIESNQVAFGSPCKNIRKRSIGEKYL